MSDPLNEFHRNRFLAALDPEDYAALEPHLKTQEVRKGQVLIAQDSPITRVHFPTGAVLVNMLGFEDGLSAAIATVGAEGMSGLSPFLAGDDCAWQVSVEAPGTVAVIKVEILREQQHRSARLNDLLTKLEHRYQCDVAQNAACNALHGALSRTARWLLLASERADSVKLELTQEELALRMGLQRTTVNTVARDLRKAGAINYLRGVISICGLEALEQAACSCYRAQRTRFDDFRSF